MWPDQTTLKKALFPALTESLSVMRIVPKKQKSRKLHEENTESPTLFAFKKMYMATEFQQVMKGLNLMKAEWQKIVARK